MVLNFPATCSCSVVFKKSYSAFHNVPSGSTCSPHSGWMFQSCCCETWNGDWSVPLAGNSRLVPLLWGWYFCWPLCCRGSVCRDSSSCLGLCRETGTAPALPLHQSWASVLSTSTNCGLEKSHFLTPGEGKTPYILHPWYWMSLLCNPDAACVVPNNYISVFLHIYIEY